MAQSFERRDTDRLKLTGVIVKYRYIDSEEVYEVKLINLSVGGICFIRDAIIKKDDTIEVLFPFESKKIKLRAKMVRVEGREAAAQFIDDQKTIDDFVHYFNLEYPAIKRAAELYEQKQSRNDLFSHRDEEDGDRGDNGMFDL